MFRILLSKRICDPVVDITIRPIFQTNVFARLITPVTNVFRWKIIQSAGLEQFN